MIFKWRKFFAIKHWWYENRNIENFLQSIDYVITKETNETNNDNDKNENENQQTMSEKNDILLLTNVENDLQLLTDAKTNEQSWRVFIRQTRMT